MTGAQPRLHSKVTESSLMPSWLGPAQSRPVKEISPMPPTIEEVAAREAHR